LFQILQHTFILSMVHNVAVFRYRSFPTVTLPLHELELTRQYACNFIGTVYQNSTREILVDVLKQSGLVDSGRCFLKTRTQYVLYILFKLLCIVVLLFLFLIF